MCGKAAAEEREWDYPTFKRAMPLSYCPTSLMACLTMSATPPRSFPSESSPGHSTVTFLCTQTLPGSPSPSSPCSPPPSLASPTAPLGPVDLRAGARCPNVDTARLSGCSTLRTPLDPLASRVGIRHHGLAHDDDDDEKEVEAGGSEVGAKGRGANPNKAGLEEYASPSIAARMTREAAQGKWRILPQLLADLPKAPQSPGPPPFDRPAELPIFAFKHS